MLSLLFLHILLFVTVCIVASRSSHIYVVKIFADYNDNVFEIIAMRCSLHEQTKSKHIQAYSITIYLPSLNSTVSIFVCSIRRFQST